MLADEQRRINQFFKIVGLTRKEGERRTETSELLFRLAY
jgi:hypothetical protein